MGVGDKIKGISLVLEVDGGLHGTEVVAHMEFAGGLEAGENAHGFS